MGIAVLDCPHCHSRHTSCVIKWEHPDRDHKQFDWGVTVCGACDKPVLVKAGYAGAGERSLMRAHGNIEKMRWHITDIYPSPQKVVAPKHCPDEVDQAYVEAMRSLQGENWNAAGMMFRRALDLSTKLQLKGDEAAEKNLFQRIDRLATLHRITPELQEWAHVIRDDGNDAAHEIMAFSEDSAKRLQSFAELYLTYVHTLPGQLEERSNPPA